MRLFRSTKAKQQASNRALPKREGVECGSRVASPKPKAVERRHPTEAYVQANRPAEACTVAGPVERWVGPHRVNA
ncbi:MAG: hypothetical protein DDT27_00837 [Dehalococcoidia bacterium]|nr:hypothetical protein [Chloroflexota bacterium]MBT9162286.1 hypothetical protein [Chloroflexota bacterium]